MSTLYTSPVKFDKQNHTYHLDGVVLNGVTGMLGRQLFPNKYDGVDEEILRKAAERGTMIHEMCEVIDDLGVLPTIQEGKSYLSMCQALGLEYETSEYLVSDEEYFASCIDKVYKQDETTYHLADIKTTYHLDTEYVRWQLSVYAYLFEKQNPQAKVGKLYAIWLRGDKNKMVEVERVPTDTIINLLECEKNGTHFDTEGNIMVKASEQMPSKYAEMEAAIIRIEEQQKYWKEQHDALAKGLMEEMTKAGVSSWKSDRLAFIRKEESERENFDSAAFKARYPDLYKEFVKRIKVKGSVTIKIK